MNILAQRDDYPKHVEGTTQLAYDNGVLYGLIIAMKYINEI